MIKGAGVHVRGFGSSGGLMRSATPKRREFKPGWKVATAYAGHGAWLIRAARGERPASLARFGCRDPRVVGPHPPISGTGSVLGHRQQLPSARGGAPPSLPAPAPAARQPITAGCLASYGLACPMPNSRAAR